METVEVKQTIERYQTVHITTKTTGSLNQCENVLALLKLSTVSRQNKCCSRNTSFSFTESLFRPQEVWRMLSTDGSRQRANTVVCRAFCDLVPRICFSNNQSPCRFVEDSLQTSISRTMNQTIRGNILTVSRSGNHSQCFVTLATGHSPFRAILLKEGKSRLVPQGRKVVDAVYGY